jgi:hypothetical protein
MNQLGVMSPVKLIRGFFYPVTEKPELQAAIDEADGAETSQRQHQLTE